MTKAELITVIMENNSNFKKSNLAQMHHADLEQLAAPYLPADETDQSEATTVETTIIKQEAPTAAAVVENTQISQEKPSTSSLQSAVEQAYENNAKMVKGPRIDKDEFKVVAIDKSLAKLAGDEDTATIQDVTLAVMEDLLQNKTAFCSINDTEKLILETIPHLDDFENVNSVMDGKSFLAKVKELHGIDTAISRGLMVALMRKQYYHIIGVKSGQKHTTIQLLERGIRYLGLTS